MRTYVDDQAKKRMSEGGIRGAETADAMRGADGKYRPVPKTAQGGQAHPDSPKSLLPADATDNPKGSARSALAKMFNTNNEYIDKARDR